MKPWLKDNRIVFYLGAYFKKQGEINDTVTRGGHAFPMYNTRQEGKCTPPKSYTCLGWYSFMSCS